MKKKTQRSLREKILKLFKSKEFLGVSFLIVVAFLMRVWWLHDNLFFGFEQGRDLLKVSDIIKGDITLLGPKTDIDGVFHGALSYYYLIPIFLLVGGSPYAMLVSLIAIHALSLGLLYLLLNKIADRRAAAIGSILFAVSYPLIIYSRWLSNPNLVVPLTILIFYSLVTSEKKPRYLLVLATSFALLIHLQIAVAVLIALPVLYLFVKLRLYKHRLYLLIAGALFGILMSTYILFEVKNNFLISNSFINNFSGEKTVTTERVKTLDGFYDHLADFFFADRRWLSFIFLLGLCSYVLLFLRKNKFAAFFVLAVITPPILFYITGFGPLRHFYNASPVFLIIVTAIVLSHLYSRSRVLSLLVLGIILFSNLQTYTNRIPENVANFLYHAQRMYLGDEQKIIDYAYAKANGQPFSYDYYSIPYWKSEAWEYLFNWYGMHTYGYRPTEKRTETFYVFMEPDESQPQYQNTWYQNLNKESLVVSSFTSRHLTVEERKLRK